MAAAPRVLLPGAFHPLHEGHLQMAAVASRKFARPAEFEISVINVDKPPLEVSDLRQRTAQFSAEQRLWLTRAPTFLQKAKLFPGAVFAVGADTIVRIGDPKYYGHDRQAWEAAINAIASRGCTFVVFGRRLEDRFETLGDLEIPENLARLCREVPEAEFRRDISSTELRRNLRAAGQEE